LFLRHNFGSIDGESIIEKDALSTLVHRTRSKSKGNSDSNEEDSKVKTLRRIPGFAPSVSSAVRTAFTTKEINKKNAEMNIRRPVLLVSSTSWTSDEDFGVLLNALVNLEKIISERKASNFPQMRLVVTGNGDQREDYEDKMKRINLKHVRLYTVFLPYSDYVTLLGGADLGICLHYSSSGVDLPMKVVDMFGCNLPVCAINYPALPELVDHEKNSLIFNDSDELSLQLFDLLKDFPTVKKLDRFRSDLDANVSEQRWNKSWASNALPFFQ